MRCKRCQMPLDVTLSNNRSDCALLCLNPAEVTILGRAWAARLGEHIPNPGDIGLCEFTILKLAIEVIGSLDPKQEKLILKSIKSRHSLRAVASLVEIYLAYGWAECARRQTVA